MWEAVVEIKASHAGVLTTFTQVATLPGDRRHRLSTRTGWSSVSVLRLGEMEILMCNFILNMTGGKIVLTGPSLRNTVCCLDLKEPAVSPARMYNATAFVEQQFLILVQRLGGRTLGGQADNKQTNKQTNKHKKGNKQANKQAISKQARKQNKPNQTKTKQNNNNNNKQTNRQTRKKKKTKTLLHPTKKKKKKKIKEKNQRKGTGYYRHETGTDVVTSQKTKGGPRMEEDDLGVGGCGEVNLRTGKRQAT